MSDEKSGFEKFLEESQNVNPPTENETLWSTENFSSRVDPPLDGDGGGPGPGDPGGPGTVDPSWPTYPEECITYPLITDFHNIQLRGIEVSVVFLGHTLTDVAFKD